MAYLGAAGKLPIVPLPFGITQHKGSDQNFDIHDRSVGDDQGRALGAGIKYSKATKLNFSNNRLTTNGVLSVIQGLSDIVRELNLSEN